MFPSNFRTRAVRLLARVLYFSATETEKFIGDVDKEINRIENQKAAK